MNEDSAADGGGALAAHWLNFLAFSIGLGAACEGLSVKSALSKFTKLSPAHISTQGLLVKNPKRQRAMMAAGPNMLRDELTRGAYTEPEIDAIFARRPATPLAALAFDLGLGMPNELPLATAYAARLDALAQEALACLEAHDLPAYSTCLTRFIDDEANLGQTTAALLALLSDVQAPMASHDMASLRTGTDRVLNYALLAFLAAVDLEWSTQYAARMTPTPTFHWLAPRFHPEFDPAGTTKIKRDLVSHPIRHLLTLCWLLTQHGHSKHKSHWEEMPPGPAELTQAIGLPDVSDVQIRKLTTGQRKCTLKLAMTLWEGLCQGIPADRSFAAPMPWMIFSIWMQTQHVHTWREEGNKRWKVVILSEPEYKVIWQAHRARWAAQLPQPGTLPWPEWLLAQSSWSDWMRPSQSSGLSPSPRDCQ
jgi:hypothetical protein